MILLEVVKFALNIQFMNLLSDLNHWRLEVVVIVKRGVTRKAKRRTHVKKFTTEYESSEILVVHQVDRVLFNLPFGPTTGPHI